MKKSPPPSIAKASVEKKLSRPTSKKSSSLSSSPSYKYLFKGSEFGSKSRVSVRLGDMICDALECQRPCHLTYLFQYHHSFFFFRIYHFDKSTSSFRCSGFTVSSSVSSIVSIRRSSSSAVRLSKSKSRSISMSSSSSVD